MSDFKYKTRGMSSPQQKSRVFFSCHPQDFGKCFESVTDEILALKNCAVWYNTEQDIWGKKEEYELNLGEMQLFVFPITPRFLHEECRARMEDFTFAVSHHIPVLPLVQEVGLEEEFNRICGNFQTLCKYMQDPTAIGYEEKLNKFLDSVLVSNEMQEKIRSAFDAYIFLSYRKKDRVYAKKLMKLIHQNEFCRDIAIWYDEFLIPGEDFNTSIRKAMEKSQLFTLVVTPNLINETNYVMTVEYPTAKEIGKSILPVEMESTEKTLLSEKYKDIPKCVNPENPMELNRALEIEFKDIAQAENNSEPMHLFLSV